MQPEQLNDQPAASPTKRFISPLRAGIVIMLMACAVLGGIAGRKVEVALVIAFQRIGRELAIHMNALEAPGVVAINGVMAGGMDGMVAGAVIQGVKFAGANALPHMPIPPHVPGNQSFIIGAVLGVAFGIVVMLIFWVIVQLLRSIARLLGVRDYRPPQPVTSPPG